jgi:solute carrier family 35
MIFVRKFYFYLINFFFLSLPMFSVLRRFSVLITMYGELCFLRVNKPFSIQLNVYLMVFGAVVAAFDDLAFDIYGYVYVMLNNIFSAFNGIFTKEKLDHSVSSIIRLADFF